MAVAVAAVLARGPVPERVLVRALVRVQVQVQALVQVQAEAAREPAPGVRSLDEASRARNQP